MAKTLKFNKMEAAERQLDVAIALWFNEADPIAIQTLTAGAHRILRDICLHRKVNGTILFDMSRIAKGKEKEYLKAVNAVSNFIKHADNDPDADIEFDPLATQLQLFDAVICYEALVASKTRNMTLFGFHFMVHHPSYFYPGNLSAVNEAFPINKMSLLSRQQFFQFFIGNSFGL